MRPPTLADLLERNSGHVASELLCRIYSCSETVVKFSQGIKLGPRPEVVRTSLAPTALVSQPDCKSCGRNLPILSRFVARLELANKRLTDCKCAPKDAAAKRLGADTPDFVVADKSCSACWRRCSACGPNRGAGMDLAGSKVGHSRIDIKIDQNGPHPVRAR
jgi:hypothetical protein